MHSQSQKWVPPKRCIGPSQIGTVLGLNKWKDAATLKHELENGYYQVIRPCMTFGIEKESTAVRFYTKQTSNKVTKANFKRAISCRLIGIADGLIGSDGGLEVKCHMNGRVLDKIPDNYLVQVVAYMFLYKRSWWHFMSCGFDCSNLSKPHLVKCHIHKIYWKNHSNRWYKEWYPQIKKFINDVNWST